MHLLREELETCSVPARFGAVARRYPRGVAVRFANTDTRFAELDARSDSLAFRLLELLGEGTEAVPFLLEPGPELAIAILGILKAGKVYLAIDPLEPEQVRGQLLAALKARVVLTHSDFFELSLPLSRLEIDRDYAAPARRLPAIEPEDIGALVRTSGSTGKPRLLRRSHRALLHRAYLYQSEHGIGPGDRQALLAGAHFVASETDLLGALLTGATVCPYPTHPLNVPDVKAWLETERVTLLHPPISFLRRLVATLEAGPHFPDLRLIALGGEAVLSEEIASWRGRFPDSCRWYHRYSSSEAGNVTAFVMLPGQQPSGPVPAGYPCPDKEVSIVDENGRVLTGPGQTGQVKVRSAFLSSGFWDDPEATSRVFSEGTCLTGDRGYLDEGGCLHLQGRADSQRKVRGNRVDLSVLESWLLAHPAVREAAVAVEGDERLVAHLVAAGSERPADLADQAEARLGRLNRPDRLDWRESLPLNRNGKLDRARLSERRTGFTAPGPRAESEELEATLRDIWERRLGMAIQSTDSFFDAGGTSLSAGEILVEIESCLGVALEPSALAHSPSPRQMAVYLKGNPGGSLLVPIQPRGSQIPLFAVHPNHGQVLAFHALARRLGHEQPLYAFRARGLLKGEALPRSPREMALEYLKELRAVQPRGPYRLAGRCFGASVALEMALMLRAEGEEVQRLIVLDGPGPLRALGPLATRLRKLHLRYRWARHLIHDPLSGLIEVLRRLRRARRCAGQPIANGTPPRPYRDLRRHFATLQQFYASACYPGEIVVFHGVGRISDAALKDWTRIAEGRVRAFPIPCEHEKLLHEPYVRLVARGLREVL